MDDMPNINDVAGIQLAISVEAICPADDPDSAYTDVKHYMNAITSVTGDDRGEWRGDEPEDSEYDSEWKVYSGTFHGDITVDEWQKIASNFCLDIDFDNGKVLPESVVPTLGILTGEGVIPAVAIEHTDEGWGCSFHEPQLIASFYVAIALKN